MRSSADNGLIDLGVQMVQDVQAGYESNWFQSFPTFETFQSFKPFDAVSSVESGWRRCRCGCSRCRSSVRFCRIWSSENSVQSWHHRLFLFRSLDHLIRPIQHLRRNRDADLLRRLEIDDVALKQRLGPIIQTVPFFCTHLPAFIS